MTRFEEILEQVQWEKMAAPQADEYDTEVTLCLAENGVSPLRDKPWRRRSAEGAITFCDGTVAVRTAPAHGIVSKTIRAAPVDHPNLQAGALLLARWPEAYAQFRRLIDTVHPYTNLSQAMLGEFAFGSSSHSFEFEFGSIHATVDHPLGFAQALIHEMAHQKLRALGVSFESAHRIIVNDPKQLFESPIRKDQLRPMTAVFHAQYSFIHVTALDLAMLGEAASERERQSILMLLARNVPRMQAGYEEIEKHVRLDDAGEVFVGAFMSWSRQLLQQGQDVLDAAGYGSS